MIVDTWNDPIFFPVTVLLPDLHLDPFYCHINWWVDFGMPLQQEARNISSQWLYNLIELSPTGSTFAKMMVVLMDLIKMKKEVMMIKTAGLVNMILMSVNIVLSTQVLISSNFERCSTLMIWSDHHFNFRFQVSLLRMEQLENHLW